MLKLLIYICTILLPFLPLKTNVSIDFVGKKKLIELKRIYWLLAGLVLSLISISTEIYTDVDIYTNIFDWTNAGNINYDTPGWSFLCRIFYSIGFNYRGMIPFILILSIFIISRACRKIAIDENKVLALMLIFPGLLNIIQLKFFLAYSMIIYAITILQCNGKHKVFKYLIIVLFATMIHSASIFCLIYLIIAMFKRTNMQKSIFLTMLGIIIVLLSLKMIPNIASIFLDKQVITRYFTGAVEVSSIMWIIEITIAWLLMVIIAWGLIGSSRFRVINKNIKNLYDKGLFISSSFTILCLTGLVLPLLIYDQNFHRFIEIEYMIGYELLLFCFQERFFNSKRNKYIIILFLMLSIIYCIRYFVPFDRVIPLFSFDGIVRVLR